MPDVGASGRDLGISDLITSGVASKQKSRQSLAVRSEVECRSLRRVAEV